ncbi:uncharacterized protein N7515_009599 [Penicillium bovifimosum]|uniref:Sister chromatid cohesion protein Dcc1 n=1 Tax=Penicillium bovifimosum TaxID=126998 RepID=A0A9W9GJL4_9EURO|nr:uncharacterized protein N7515_009599 [Penicillium bovifimosum]KAJ5121638.1 hypothetical protein N7515_009599 [Penicillium bovifimosum]
MSTQAAPSILFTHTNPQDGFRLLELSPELEELLTSKDAPVLELKSPSTALAQAVLDPAAQDYVNLCTPTQTYRIRQVQSSNSLHILRPSHAEISQADIKVVTEDEDPLSLPSEAVTAIAKCSSTLELHIPPGGFSAVPFLEKSLRLYDPRADDGDVAMEAESAPLDAKRVREMRERLWRDIPVSEKQCASGWMEVCGFVDSGEEIACWRPSARARLRVWKRVVEGSVLQGIDLEKQFLVRDLWRAVLDEDDEVEVPFPRALLEAVVRRICVEEERVDLRDEIKWASFDRVECTQWVGETYLAATAPISSSAIGRSEFLRGWKDCLPESWRAEAALSKLKNGCYSSPDPTTIFFVEPSQRQQASKTSSAPATAAKAKNTRNWHELLKGSR